MRRGLTLVETVVTVALFALVGLVALSASNLALRHWRTVNDRVGSNENARRVASLVTAELRQGIPNPNPLTGWPAAGLSEPSAVLEPTPDEPISDQLVFTEPDVANYNPLHAGWDRTRSENYLRVRYYLEAAGDQEEIRREQIRYGAMGGIADTREEVLARGEDLELEVERLSGHLVSVRVASREGRYRTEYVTRPFLVGR